jgi:hypothetical protein
MDETGGTASRRSRSSPALVPAGFSTVATKDPSPASGHQTNITLPGILWIAQALDARPTIRTDLQCGTGTRVNNKSAQCPGDLPLLFLHDTHVPQKAAP